MNKKRVFFIVLLACVLSLCCAFIGCSKKNDDRVEVASVTLSENSVELQMGGTVTATLTATVLPDNATEKQVTWSSSAPEVVTVEDGVLTALKAGSATVTATAGGKSDICTVIVLPASTVDPADVPVTGVTLDKTSATLKMGETTTVTLTATVAPANATNKGVTWSSSDANVATVENGIVTAVSAGTTGIKVTTSDGGYAAVCTVTVEAADVTPDPDPDPTPDPDGYTTGIHTLDIAGGSDADIFTSVIVGSDSGYNETYYKLSSSSSAGTDYLYANLKVQAGKIIKVTGKGTTSNKTDSSKSVTLGISLKSGSTGAVNGLPSSFTVSQSDGVKAFGYTYTVTTEGIIILQFNRTSGNTGCDISELVIEITDPVPVNVESVALDKTASALKVGESGKLTATVTPADADNTAVMWSSSDQTVVSVDVEGNVTALKAGTATVTVTTVDGGKTASCEYTVTNIEVESVTLDRTSATIAVGKTITVKAAVTPDNATVKTVTWTSSNQSVATVNKDGVVTAVSAGAATITATADGGKTAEFTVTVVAEDIPVTGVTLNETSVAKYVGDTLQLTAEVAPANALDQSVEWTTDNAAIATVDQTGLVRIVGEGTVTITVTSNNNSSAKATCVITATYQTFEVTFKDGDTTVKVQTVRRGETAARETLSKEGFALVGWYGNSALTGTAFDFNTPVTADITLYAKWQKSEINITYYQGNYESAAVEWSEPSAADAKVEFKLESADDGEYTQADSELIRQISGGTARVDVLGLKGGETYNIKVTSSTLGESVLSVPVKKYDRSGYAHFNYTEGVGAYNDDGTLKDNVLVIYLTEQNKLNVLDYCYVDGVKVDISQYMTGSDGTEYTGIGELLNNRRYAGSDRMNVGIGKLTQVYGGVAVRILGEVSNSFDGDKCTLTGLTDYNSTGNGGTAGDSGGMARMVNAKNVTIEGIGEDAVVKGWGFHFISNDALHQYEGSGKSFEVRNITFTNYPEDAIGMEGQQGTKVDPVTGSVTEGDSSVEADLVSPVERCWIHHNVFLQGGGLIAGAESDKNEGDGSCDFKRGQYYTLSYNYFDNCHKTNLIGSGGTSLSFNVTMHHNWWHNVKARQPLARCANIHYYNNYISGATDTVISARANCYIFAEGNYFYGCKNVTEYKSEGGVGAVKAYNNVYNGNYEANDATIVTEREQQVSNNCKFIYRSIDYSLFDTDPDLFYYDTENGQSDCFLEDAVSARKTVMAQAGVLGFGRTSFDMNENTLDSALSIPEEGLTVNLANISGGGIIGTAKGKGQVITFRLAERADITVECSGGVLADSNGTVYADHFTSYTGTLEAGLYFISSQQLAFSGDKLGGANLKEVTVTSLSFKLGVTDAERVQNVIDYINAIGTVELTAECKSKIDLAQIAYNALNSALQAQVTNADTLSEAITQYDGLVAAPVIAAINAIGAVSAESGSAIASARIAYENLTVEQKKLVTNYNTLVAAEASYEGFKVEGVNKAISDLTATSAATTEQAIRALLAEYKTVKGMYEALDQTQQAQVENYTKVTEGIEALNEALKPYEVIELIATLPDAANVTLANGAAISEARQAYNELTEEQKAIVDISRLTAAEEAYAVLASQTTVAIFTKDNASLATGAGFTVSGSYKSGASFEYDGVTYNSPLKLESSTLITFTTDTVQKITIKIYTAGGQIKVDNDVYDDSDNDGFIVIDSLAVGAHTIAKASGDPNLCYVILEPVG